MKMPEALIVNKQPLKDLLIPDDFKLVRREAHKRNGEKVTVLRYQKMTRLYQIMSMWPLLLAQMNDWSAITASQSIEPFWNCQLAEMKLR